MNIKEQESKKQRERESPAGYHFYYLYHTCPRKWMLKYIFGWKPRYTAPPLIFGGAIHFAKHQYYINKLEKDILLDSFNDYMNIRKPEYESGIKFGEDLARGIMLLDFWFETWNEHDRTKMQILEVEKQHSFMIGPNEEFLFTVRPDLVAKEIDIQQDFVFDTKTSAWSVPGTFKTANQDDQMTSYIWALNKKYPHMHIDTAKLDIMYNRGKVINCTREYGCYRTKNNLVDFELNIVGTIFEVSSKVKSLKSGLPHPMLFPRNGRECGLFDCQYRDVCRSNLKMGKMPIGFVKDEWVEVDKMLEKVQNGSLSRYFYEEEEETK